MKKMMLHVLAVGVIAGVLAGVGVYAYQREDGFTPSADSPEIQENHVVFEDEEKEEPEVKKSTGESDIWEKNRQSKEKLDRMPDSSALFSRTRTSVKDSTPDRYENSSKGKKVPVQLKDDPDQTDKTIRVARTDPDTDETDDGNTDPDTPGTTSTQTTDVPAGTQEPGDGSSSYTSAPSDTEEPSQTPQTTDVPAATKKPVPPEKEPDLPKGDSLIESMYPGITEFPSAGVENKKLHALISPIFDIDHTEYVYYGAELTREKLLCSVLIYVLDENNKVLYRITSYSENFQIGSFPAIAEDDFTVNFMFRENSTAAWQTIAYEFSVSPYKYFIMNSQGKVVEELTPEEPELNLLDYYTCNLTQKQKKELTQKKEYSLDQIIPGWKDANENTAVSDLYSAPGKGWKSFVPQDPVSLPAGYEAKLVWHVDLDHFEAPQNLKNLQTLTAVPSGIKDLEVMAGIHQISLKNCRVRTITLAESTAVVSSDGLVVEDAYKVPAENPYLMADDGVLYSKDQTILYSVPYNREELQVPEKTTEILIPEENSLKKIVLTSGDVTSLTLEHLYNAVIEVPGKWYDSYYAMWNAKLPETVSLERSDEQEKDTIIRDGAVLSADGTVLFRVQKNVRGNYIVPDGVQTIKKGALDSCKKLLQITLPSSVETLEDGSLSSDELEKVVITGSRISDKTGKNFADSGVEILVTPQLYRSWPEKSRPAKLEKSRLELFSDESGSYLLQGDSAVLLKASEDLEVYERTEAAGYPVTEIAPGAFQNSEKLCVAVLPESVKKIDTYAFLSCSKLQGILCESEDVITVDSDAYYDCGAIRFAAYNAKKAEFENNYCPGLIGFYPAGASGYPAVNTPPHNNYELVYASRFFLEGSPDRGMYLYADFNSPDDNEARTYLVGVAGEIGGTLHFREDVAEILFYAFHNIKDTFYIDFTEYPLLYAIDEAAFGGSGLTGRVVLPEGLLYRDVSSFSQCKGIGSVEIRSLSLKKIPGYCFSSCTGIKEITIDPDCQLEEIGFNAFSETAIRSLIIPEKVTAIYNSVFSGCRSLQRIYMRSRTPAEFKMEGQDKSFTWGTDLPDGFRICVLADSLTLYQKQWSGFADILSSDNE